MTISTQSVGVLVMAAMAMFGLAVITDITKQKSVVERMLFYQADELAMDMEMMQTWDEGYIEKNLPRQSYNITVKPPSLSYENKFEGSPKVIVLESSTESAKAAIQTNLVTVPNVDLEGVEGVCIEKTGGQITVDGGEC